MNHILKYFTSILSISFLLSGFSQVEFPEEKIIGSNETPTYNQLVSFFKNLSVKNDDISLFNFGNSDYGEPLYVCVLNAVQDSTATFETARNGLSLLVNNGIHPGEPCGINASMKLAKDFTKLNEQQKKAFPIIAIVLSHNVGGTFNRSSTSRVNQVGPEEYGFRGNARNYDLNRDFIKMDTENAWAFTRLFHALDPDIFVDTHTTNGADYSYVLTYIHPIKEVLPPSLKSLTVNELILHLTDKLKTNWQYDLFPYVVLKDRTLDKGIVSFDSSPRYSIGYTQLFNTISLITESHMLKPFEERVKSTYAFLVEVVEWMQEHNSTIKTARKGAFEYQVNKGKWKYNFQRTENADSIFFKGFEWNFQPSKITGKERLKYHSDKPWNEHIPFYNEFTAKDSLEVPSYYIVKNSEKEILKRLKVNRVEMKQLQRDTTIFVKAQFVEDFSTIKLPFEGHYLHYDTKVQLQPKQVVFRKGDWLISANQRAANFLHNVLFAEMTDSYFNWNFMDSYLNQKEYFSPYLFEETAEQLLTSDSELKKNFEQKKLEDKEFNESAIEQLRFIYQNSKYFEKSYRILPVYLVY